MNGALCHLKGRDDFISIFAFELPPGSKSKLIRHIYEEVIYVVSGNGSTTVTLDDGSKHSFEWGPKSLFAIPLNAMHQHFNGSGLEPARFASANNMVFVMNRFRSESLIFECPVQFPERAGGAHYSWGKVNSSEAGHADISGKRILCRIFRISNSARGQRGAQVAQCFVSC